MPPTVVPDSTPVPAPSARQGCTRTRRLARQAGALAWTVAAPLLFSALVHSTDAGVGGIAGLTRPGVPVSVAVWAVPMAVLALITLWVRVRVGLLASLATALLLAAAPGWLILVLGSTATSPFTRLASFLVLTAMCLVALAVAALPSAAVGWPDRSEAGGA